MTAQTRKEKESIVGLAGHLQVAREKGKRARKLPCIDIGENERVREIKSQVL